MNEWLPKFKGKVFLAKIAECSQGLTYISETDSAIEPFAAGKRDTVDAKFLFEEYSHEIEVEELSFDEFFARLTKQRDWFGPEQKEKAKRFAELESLLREILLDLKGFKVGRIQIDIFVVGVDAVNEL